MTCFSFNNRVFMKVYPVDENGNADLLNPKMLSLPMKAGSKLYDILVKESNKND